MDAARFAGEDAARLERRERVRDEEEGIERLRHFLGLYFRAPNVSKDQDANAISVDGAHDHDEGGDEEAGGENERTIDGGQGNVNVSSGTTSFVQRERFYQTDKERNFGRQQMIIYAATTSSASPISPSIPPRLELVRISASIG
ncbi:hypothetical protein MMC34_004078 [Xylographa carneopallida]|nr:hypothetical protein [Xylographa carneopallida]